MQFKEDPKNLIVPLELTKIIYSEWDAEQVILDRPDQVYGKALHGQGRAVFKNQNIYEGEFYNGMLHGKGKFTWVNGVIYEGDFNYNKITGMGTYTWPDGSVYKGQVFNGLRHGDGKFTAPSQSAVYEGQWQEGLRHGNGKVNFKSGAVYEGEFVNGNKHGSGKMVYPSGNVYQGAFLLDRKCGYGTMQWLSTNEKYFGMWDENSQNGWGTHIWLEPKGEGSKFLRNRYEGEWMNGERSGVGVFYYANGAKYVGEWQANMKQGLAVFITDSGGIILGQFKQDRLSSVYSTTENEHGSGILPKEIAPKSKEEQDQLQVQMTKVQVSTTNRTNLKNDVANTTKKSGNPNITHEKLVGLNSPGHQLTSSQLNTQPKTIEANPYSYLVDFTDLFRGQTQYDLQQIELNVQTMLLRHNSTLRQWYKFFATKFEHFLSENTFALNFEGFWKIIRDAKLLNPNFTIASLNRLFFQGCKNRYPLTHDQSDVRKQIEFLKKNTNKVNLNEMDDVFHMKYSQDCIQSLKDTPLDYEKLNEDRSPNLTFNRTPLDVQNPSNVILYRHFIEFLVRIAYLKYNSLSELHRAVERIIINKLTPLYERKLGKGLNQSEEETHSMHMKNKINFEDFVQDFKVLFDRYAIDVMHSQYGYVDRTVTLADVFSILERAGLMIDSDKTFIVGHLEKYFDNEEGTLNQLSSIDQSSAQLGVSKDEKTKRRKQRDTETSHLGGGGITDSTKENHLKHLNRVDKWVQFLNYELTLYEFSDVMIFALCRKNKEMAHPKEDEQRSRVLTVLNRLIQIQPKIKKNQQQARIFVRSIKDQQKEELRLQRINQEARAKQRQLLEEQRKKEERERNLMALEDQDVKSDFEEEPESEEEDY